MSLLLPFPHNFSLSISNPTHSSLIPFHTLSSPNHTSLSFTNSHFNSPSLSLSSFLLAKKKARRPRGGTFCFYTNLPPETLQWVCTVSSAALMLSKGTSIHKSFLVPLFALQAPISVVSWIKGEYGGWSAFLALLVRLFYYIPGELELPFLALLFVTVAPYQAMDLRGTQAGAIISLAIAGFLALQHFTKLGSLKRAFEQGSIIATIAIICITLVPCFFLF